MDTQKIVQNIYDFTLKNSVPLFKTDKEDFSAIFDNKGFFLSDEADYNYNYRELKSKPHLYVAYNSEKYVYVGKSNQKGGRWQRYNYYHLGTLAKELLGQRKSRDQKHYDWCQNWMEINSISLGSERNKITLKSTVKIAFIPFEQYSNLPIDKLRKEEVKSLNTKFEKLLIKFFDDTGWNLLNRNKPS